MAESHDDRLKNFTSPSIVIAYKYTRIWTHLKAISLIYDYFYDVLSMEMSDSIVIAFEYNIYMYIFSILNYMSFSNTHYIDTITVV